MLGHGDIVDERIARGRGRLRESEANDFAGVLPAPAAAVAGWHDRHGDPAPDLDTLVEPANAFGLSVWAATERANAAHKLSRERQVWLTAERQRLERRLLLRRAFLGGLKDTLTAPPAEILPRGACGPPAVLRVPARRRAWALHALAAGRLSLEAAAGYLGLDPQSLVRELEGAGVELRTPRPDRRRAAGGRDLEDLRHERLRVDRRSHVASVGRENGQLGDLG